MVQRARARGWSSQNHGIAFRTAPSALVGLAALVVAASTALVARDASADPTGTSGATATATAKPAGKTASAATKGASAKSAAPPKLSADTLKRLSSTDEGDLRSALDDVRLVGPGAAAAAPQIAAILDRGAHRELTVAALETLGDLQVATTGPSIVPYTGHREIAIRRAAVSALAGTHGEGSVMALQRALGDPDEQVRGSAARGLATKDASAAGSELVAAIDHKVVGAGAALGASCTQASCMELAARVGRGDSSDMTTGLDALFARPDLPDSVKMDVLEKLGSSSDPSAHTYLVGLRQRQQPAKKGSKGSNGSSAKGPKESSAFSKALDAAVTGVGGAR